MTNCTCRTFMDGKTRVTEICGWHLVVRDKDGNVIDWRKPVESPYVGKVRYEKNVSPVARTKR